jgi:hypothetical protein
LLVWVHVSTALAELESLLNNAAFSADTSLLILTFGVALALFTLGVAFFAGLFAGVFFAGVFLAAGAAGAAAAGAATTFGSCTAQTRRVLQLANN